LFDEKAYLLVPRLRLGNAIARQAPLGRPRKGRNPITGAKQSFAAREVPKQELGKQNNQNMTLGK
jgi:hypothetical protein